MRWKLCLIFVGLWISGITSASALSSDLTQITINGSQQNGALISRDLVVWTDWRGDTALDIWAYDINTKTEYPLIIKPGFQVAKVLNNRFLVYDDVEEQTIRIHYLNRTKDEALINVPVGARALAADDRNLVYQVGGGDGDLYLYDLVKHSSLFLGTKASYANISDQYISWDENVGPGKSDIRVYDIRRRKIINIPNPSNFVRGTTDLDGNLIVFEETSVDPTTYSIIVYDLRRNKIIFNYVALNASSVGRPAISNKFVVWSESPAPHCNIIKAANYKTGEVVILQEEGPHQNSIATPDIFKDKAVWSAWRTGNGDIYMADIGR